MKACAYLLYVLCISTWLQGSNVACDDDGTPLFSSAFGDVPEAAGTNYSPDSEPEMDGG